MFVVLEPTDLFAEAVGGTKDLISEPCAAPAALARIMLASTKIDRRHAIALGQLM